MWIGFLSSVSVVWTLFEGNWYPCVLSNAWPRRKAVWLISSPPLWTYCSSRDFHACLDRSLWFTQSPRCNMVHESFVFVSKWFYGPYQSSQHAARLIHCGKRNHLSVKPILLPFFSFKLRLCAGLWLISPSSLNTLWKIPSCPTPWINLIVCIGGWVLLINTHIQPMFCTNENECMWIKVWMIHSESQLCLSNIGHLPPHREKMKWIS